MKRQAPSALVTSLDPPEEAVLKRETGTVIWVETRPGGERTVVKLYRKRGAGPASRARITRFRAEREYRRLRHLQRWNIPCTEPLSWGAGWSTDHGFHEVLVMREVPNAVELREYVRTEGIPLAPLYQMVRRMHESGLCNQTLYARNVLVSRDAPPGEGYVIADIPRSWTFPQSIVGTDMALYDLLDLTAELEKIGVPRKAIPLDAYGLDERAEKWWAKAQKRNSRAKLRRLARDARARVRWASAWALGWRSRQEPTAVTWP